MGILDNRVIIITGATSGMGKGMALKFARQGARLILNGRNEEKGMALLQDLKAHATNIFFVAGDIGLHETNKLLVDKAIEKFGKLDTIVGNAGILGLGEAVHLPVAEWKETLEINLSSLFYLSKYSVPHMQKNGSGVILTIASIAAFKSFPNHAAYCAAKAGQVALTRQLAAEYGPVIRANVICPGPVNTPLIWDSAKAFDNPAEAVQDAGNNTLLKRLGLPADIAELALFLVSDASSWMTGSVITIDGGITVR